MRGFRRGATEQPSALATYLASRYGDRTLLDRHSAGRDDEDEAGDDNDGEIATIPA